MVNCWEHKRCGREPGGRMAKELGVCPAAIAVDANGFAGGKNGGRGCAYVTGTFCGGVIQGTVKDKKKVCNECDFYHILKREHGAEMTVLSFGNYVRRNRKS